MCQLIKKEFPSLEALLQAIKGESRQTLSPPQHRSFFSEIARCSPACGIFQMREKEAVYDVLQEVILAKKNVFDSQNHSDFYSRTMFQF